MDLFSINGKLFHFLYKVADLMLLSILWVFCSLPMVTIGAASTALYYCVIKVIREDGASPAKRFFRAFWENFKQGSYVVALALLGVSW